MKTFHTKFAHSMIVFLGMLASWLIPSSVWASVYINGIFYELNSSTKTATMTFQPSDGSYSGQVDIPASFTYNGIIYNVTRIGDAAFSDCPGLNLVTIPNSVTNIGQMAFSGCTGLVSITIPNSVIGMGTNAFENCINLTSISIPNSVTSISYATFWGCTGLTSIEIPNSVTSIGSNAFCGCTGLTSLTVEGETPPSISGSTFDNVDKTNCMLYVPAGSKPAYESASGWSEFQNIVEYTPAPEVLATGSCGDNVSYTVYSDMIMKISGSGEMWDYDSESCVLGRYRINKVIINEGVTTIGNWAFCGNNVLTSVEIANSVTSIGDGAFDGCTGLTSADIPNRVNSIGREVFCGCTSLTSIIVSEGNNNYDSRNNCNAIIETATNTLISGCKNTVIPNSVTIIGEGAFSGCTSLTSVEIPNSVTRISNSAFYYCSELTSVTIPNSVTEIGDDAFFCCNGLTSVEIPNSLVSIGNYAFNGCTSLTSVLIPKNVMEIGSGAFDGCTSMTSVIVEWTVPLTIGLVFCDFDKTNCTLYVPSGSKTAYENAEYWSEFENIVEYTPGPAVLATGSCGDNVTYTIYSDMTMVISGTGAMEDLDTHIDGCASIQKLIIEDGVTSIGDCSFSGCPNLTSATIPNSVTRIGDAAFSGCTSLASVTIPDNVTTIGGHAFQECTGLSSISFGNRVNTIGDFSFYNCSGLSSVFLPNDLITIGQYAFAYCKGLFSVNIPDNVITISSRAFYNCSSLTSIEIGKNVTSIESYAFQGCSSLSSVVIPKSVNGIEHGIFSGCTDLMSITVESSNSVFDSRNNCNAIIETSTNKFISGCKNSIIPDDVTSIEKDAFNAIIGLSSLTIPQGVTSIGEGAFSGCRGLSSISIPESVSFIGYGAFQDCNQNLGSIIVDINNSSYDSRDNCNALIETSTNTLILGCNNTSVIPNGVVSIGEYAFYNCIELKSLFIPESVKTFGHCAFTNCMGLSTITNESETPISIDNQTFLNVNKVSCTLYVPIGCRSNYQNAPFWNSFLHIAEHSIDMNILASSSCGDNVTYTIYSDMTMVISGTGPLYDYDIDGWNSIHTHIDINYYKTIENVVIEDGVTNIGKCAFLDCIGLSTVSIPNSVTMIDSHAFSGCIGLNSITIPNSVTNIGRYAFSGCTGLTSIKIPNSVTLIAECAFEHCSGLTSLMIPNSVTSIGAYVLSNCTSLTSLIIENEIPLSISDYPFWGLDKVSCTLYVPAGSKTAYESASGWNEFQNIVEYTPGLTVLATGSCGDNVTYTIYSDKSMVISGTGAMTNFTINYDDDTVNRENNEYWLQVKTVTIDEGVTSIGNYAFSNCTELTSVSIPNSVTSIGAFAFLGCSVLTSITIPASVETIGADALSYTGLTHIYIEDCDDVLQFEQVAFDMDDYEDPLEYVYLGRNIKTMSFNEDDPWEGVEGNPPFSRSRNLHTLEIGDKVTYLEDWSFSSAPLESLVIGSNVQSIGIRALSSANVGQTLVIPSNVKRMGDYSLSPSISTLVLEKGSDDLELFAGYNSLELSFFGSESSIDSIYVGRNLTCSSNNIHVVCRSACFDASLRRTMNTSGEEEEFDLSDNYIPPVCATKYYFRSGASVGEYYFQNSPVEHVYNLRSSRVGNYAFFNSNVKTVSFDAEGSSTIGNGVFSGCDGLTTLSLPEGMTDIGDNAFMDCYGLTSITIPSSLKSIGDYCFFMDDTERNVSFNVYISDLSAWCSMDIGWGGSPLIWGHLIYNGEEISNLVVPDDVQSIGMGAFDGCSTLTSVLIPESVTSIGDRAFYCTGLTSVTMKSTVPLTIDGSTFEGVDKSNCILYVPTGSKTAYENAEGWSEFQNIVEYTYGPEILATGPCGDNATCTIYSDMTMVISGTGAMWDITGDDDRCFWANYNYQNVIVEEGVTRIGDDAFRGCTSLNSVTIPEGVSEIGNNAFDYCTSLTSITIPSTVTWIGGYAFANTAWYNNQADGLIYINNVAYRYKGAMPSGTEVVISDGTVCISGDAFHGCTGLTSVTIPGSVTSIGNSAFSGCTGLVSVNIPNSLTTISDEAFYHCTALTSVTIPNSVTEIQGGAFEGCTGLTSISIGEGVSRISIAAFSGCSVLTSIYLSGATPAILGNTFGQGISSVFDGVDKTNCTLFVPVGSKTAYESASGWSAFENIVENVPDTDISAYDNIVYIEGTEAIVGQRVRLSLNMNNTIAPTGFQCDVYLPDGVTAAQDEDGFYLMDISTERTTVRKTDYSNSVMQPDGGLRFMCSSTNSFTFSGNEGEVAYLMVDIDPNMEEGTYPLILRNIEISDANSNPYRVSYVKTTLTVHTYTLGDANNDGSIGVSDFTAIANYIMGTPPASFVEKAADVNVDGVISVSDLTGEANIILYGTVTPNASHAKARNEATAKYANIGAKDVTAATDKEFTVAVSINGNYAYSGYQFDVALPEGMTVKDVYGQTKSSDVFMSGMIDGNTLRVLCASTMGETTESSVVNLTLVADSEGSYNIDIDNAVVSANASSYDLSKTAFCVDIDSSATGISSLNGEAGKKVVVYDLQGRRQNEVQGGRIGVVNGNTIYRK